MCQAPLVSRVQGRTLTEFAFDAAAADYDDDFSRSVLGTLMRRAVWRRLDQCFQPGDRILEFNCGTGEDAIHLARRGVRVLATDRSEAMLAVTSRKVEAAGLQTAVEFRQLALEDLSSFKTSPFDGSFSNFGGLNCVSDLRGFGRGLAGLVRQGGVVVLCVMGPVVPWEWIWYLAHAQPRKAFRRLQVDGATWRGLHIEYPSLGAGPASAPAGVSLAEHGCRRGSATSALYRAVGGTPPLSREMAQPHRAPLGIATPARHPRRPLCHRAGTCAGAGIAVVTSTGSRRKTLDATLESTPPSTTPCWVGRADAPTRRRGGSRVVPRR